MREAVRRGRIGREIEACNTNVGHRLMRLCQGKKLLSKKIVKNNVSFFSNTPGIHVH